MCKSSPGHGHRQRTHAGLRARAVAAPKHLVDRRVRPRDLGLVGEAPRAATGASAQLADPLGLLGGICRGGWCGRLERLVAGQVASHCVIAGAALMATQHVERREPDEEHATGHHHLAVGVRSVRCGRRELGGGMRIWWVSARKG